MALKVGQGKKDSIKLHIKTATCDFMLFDDIV